MWAAKISLAILVLAGSYWPASAQDDDDPAYWVEVYEGTQNAHSYDYLLNCWADQWPGEVKFYEGPSAATEEEMESAIRATRDHCQLQIEVRLDQIRIDLARRGMLPREIEGVAPLQLETELDEMFSEYWSRL